MTSMNKLIMGLTLTLGLSLGLALGASAADYDIPGAEPSEIYRPTLYSSAYGAEYSFGSKNVCDYDIPPLRYGVVSTTSIGAAEQIVLPFENKSGASSYGVSNAISYDAFSAPLYTPVQAISYTSASAMERSDGSIGTVKIPSLGISMKVWEGETNDSMANGLGHYSSTSAWDGNVGVCGHNRGAKYTIGTIKDLSIGDNISYTTVYGTRKYSVSYVGTISNTDWTYLQGTSDNRITLTTCLADHPESRVVVQAVEVIKK